MKKLYFVRHGQSQANIDGIFSGQSETKLTAEGKKQAKQTGQKIKKNNIDIDLIISSPLSRAYDTAVIIAREISYPVKDIAIHDLLKERSFGELEGKSAEEFFANFDYQHIDNIKNAETLEMLQKRAEKALKHLKTFEGKRILVVSHGSFARSLKRAVNGEPYRLEYKGPIDRLANAEIIELI